MLSRKRLRKEAETKFGKMSDKDFNWAYQNSIGTMNQDAAFGFGLTFIVGGATMLLTGWSIHDTARVVLGGASVLGLLLLVVAIINGLQKKKNSC